jgi:hypothetical protein
MKELKRKKGKFCGAWFASFFWFSGDGGGRRCRIVELFFLVFGCNLWEMLKYFENRSVV